MSRISLFAVWTVILVLIAGCERVQPVYNVSDAPILASSASNVTEMKVRDAIVAAAQSKRWVVQPAGNGHLIATVTVRKHKATVDIFYTAKTYSITYKSSSDLLYDGTKIHRNYNKWVKLLDERIRRNINAL